MACLCKKRRAGKVRALGRAQQWQPQAHRLPQLLVCAAQVTEHSLQVTAAHPQQLGDEEARGGEERWRESPISLLGNWLLTFPSAGGISKEPNAGTSDVQKGKHPKATSTGPAGCPGIVRSPITAAAVGTFAQLWYVLPVAQRLKHTKEVHLLNSSQFAPCYEPGVTHLKSMANWQH